MKHLILGSSGQIGAYLVDHLRTVECDTIQEWDIELSEDNDLRYYNEYNGLIQAISSSDIVHFLAFDVGGSTYLSKYQNTYEFIDNNIKMMDNVFGLLRSFDKPFIFASSQMSNMFGSVYGRLKAVGEAYTDAIPKGINVRFWNVFGIEKDPNKTHVVTDFIRMALQDKRILIRTDGTEIRNFLYADDAANMLTNLAYGLLDRETGPILHEVEQRRGAIPIANSSADPWTINRLAHCIRDLIDPDIPIYKGEQKDTGQDKFNDDYKYPMIWELSMLTKGKEFTDIKAGLKKIIQYEKELMQ